MKLGLAGWVASADWKVLAVCPSVRASPEVPVGGCELSWAAGCDALPGTPYAHHVLPAHSHRARTQGNDKLNLGFVASLFNACPGLAPPDESMEKTLSLFDEIEDEDIGDTREARPFPARALSINLL